ncbi:MAG: hybrid sensor histidine kinase/response regulator [Magnetococcus sp. DMHC-1]
MNGLARRESILIVDDVPGNIKTLMAILQMDYELLVAKSGRQAIDLAKSRVVDLILLDVVMPEMDGYAVCKHLKELPETAHIPIIFLTAKCDTTDETLALELGAVDFLTKPANPPVVKARVKTHLGLKSARQTLEQQNRELRDAAQLREDVDRVMRHDLKSPLNTIIGFTDMLSSTFVMDKDQAEMCAMILDAGYTLLKMINLSLDLYKMERGSYVFKPEEIDFLPLIHKIHEVNLALFRSNKIAFDILIEGRQPVASDKFLILGEELLCFSMLSNLIKNALEASPKGETITVALTSGKPDARIAIHNKGSVPVAIREKFFEKYVTAGKVQGTGLGTYSAKLMAETQNGGIDLDTSDAQATTITVRLPMAG